MKKSIITIFTILLLITSGVNFVSAENSTEKVVTNVNNMEENKIPAQRNAEEEKNRTGETVKSKENGHFNITFDDGYNGYCINYGDQEAKVNDEFKVHETSSAINNENGESIGHYLKTFFVEFHDIAVKNKYDTQKIIWAFSDNFDFNKHLVQQIKDASVNLIIPDHGAIKKINETTEAIFDFEVLKTGQNDHQNFFGYKITYRDIPLKVENNTAEKEENTTIHEQNKTNQNTTTPNENITEKEENTTIHEQNKTNQNTTTPNENKTENITNTTPNENKTENITNTTSKNQTGDIKENIKSEHENKPVSLLKHTTGAELAIILITLIFGFILVNKYYKRD